MPTNRFQHFDIALVSEFGIATASAGGANASHKVLKSGVCPKRIHSGIHPDPWYSSGVVADCQLQRVKSFFIFSEVNVSAGNEKPANITCLRQFQRMF
jgi:hypothetical protein